MTILRRAFFAGLWLALATATPAAAGLAPTRASQLVTLIPGDRECDIVGPALDQQLLPDGSTRPFSVADKQVLIVTEVDWGVTRAPASATASFTLVQEKLPQSVFIPFFLDGALTDSTGTARRVASVADAVVGPGTQLCVLRIGPGDFGAVVRGFLAPDR